MGASDTGLRVLVLGYGEMGHAMETLLGGRHTVAIWQRRLESGSARILEQMAAGSNFILFCLPAMAHEEVAGRLRGHVATETVCVTIAKGVNDAGQTPYEILTGSIEPDSVAVLYGPMISEEIRAGRSAFAQACAANANTSARLSRLFSGTALHVEASRDRSGLTWSAILKNVYAMAFGMADELKLGDNVRGYLAVIALHELDAIVRHLGGAPSTPFHLAGLGDLITTATSSGSHHHDLGRRLARGEQELSGEGLHTISALAAHPRFPDADFPLYRLISSCARNPSGASDAIRHFVDSGQGLTHGC